MKRLLLLAVPILLLAPAQAAGDGCPPEMCGMQSSAVPGSPVVALRPLGTLDAYDVRSGRLRYSLPWATLSADGRVAWVPGNGRRVTVLKRYDAVSGRLVRQWRLGPRLSVPAVSADGRRVVLQAPGSATRTRIIVFDARTAYLQPVTLDGNFAPEAISLDGRRLFLVQYVKAGYRVRLYDLARGRLQPGELKARNEDEPMRGFPAYAVGAPDGHWLLTLYVKPRQREAFVHALDLRRGVAYCLDLPGHGSSPELSDWALSLGLDGRSLYAANAAVGLATRIDLSTLEAGRPLRIEALHVTADQFVSSALSPRGDLVYFGSLHGLWAWDLRANRVRGPYRPNRIGGFAFTPGGRRLVVITPGGRALWLDAATGRRV
jgi:hypothetical protein